MIRCTGCGHDNADGITFCAKCGKDLPLGKPTSGRPSAKIASPGADIGALIANGNKIEAIKRYREQTGLGLAEAKAAVEALERNRPAPPQLAIDPALESRVVALLQKGAVIPAIKVYRNAQGCQLKEAKDAVYAIAERYGIKTPKSAGCGLVLAVVFLILVGCAIAALVR